MNRKTLYLPLIILIAIVILLSIVQIQVDKPLILLERFINGGGWIEIFVIAIYGAFMAFKMQNPAEQSKWRIRSWTIFSIAFFLQLLIGLLGFEEFLMTGKLHLPIPMMIVAGPVYRLELSFMPILFLSTIILSGPAWCSQLCYFGALDANLAKRKKTGKNFLWNNIMQLKLSGLTIIIAAAILLRIFKVPVLITSIIAGSFGVIGVLLMLFYSGRTGRMVNCILWCPVGTLISYLKNINPFRFRIADSCTSCMRCVPVCRYGALSEKDIKNGKPGITCTLCGDCISVCKPGSLHYSFPGLGTEASRKLYLGITITLHAVFLALARM